MKTTPRLSGAKAGAADRGREAQVRGMMVLTQPQQMALAGGQASSGSASARTSRGAGNAPGVGTDNSSDSRPSPSDDDGDEDFRALRMEAKQRASACSGAASGASGIPGHASVVAGAVGGATMGARSLVRPAAKAGAAILAAPASARGGSKTTAAVRATAAVGEDTRGIVNVDPCYFDYKAACKSHRSMKAEASGGAVADTYVLGGAEEEMFQFLQGQGLTGPLRVYAKAFVLQGVKDAASLVTATDERLNVIFTRAEMDCTDELLLRDALRALR
eukprot:TRINITY_DN63329_c0_g1_i1.p1 TRINITY_DN63329_c0_g1~~TRINITY_DN63329_c0_g1_i1.p1  ORF type:complete len:275 (+),score=62.64 TRINITY_DN63329_c0_g1_i1:227-1051(+)